MNGNRAWVVVGQTRIAVDKIAAFEPDSEDPAATWVYLAGAPAIKLPVTAYEFQQRIEATNA